MATQTIVDPYHYLRKSPMELLIMQQAMAQNADANTLGGFAIGKLLRGLFNDWKSNYDFRGAQRRLIFSPNTPPEERNKLLAEIQRTDPKRYEQYVGQLAEQGINIGNTPQTVSNTTAPTITAPTINTTPTIPVPTQTPQQSDTAGINPTARARRQSLFGEDFLKKQGLTLDEPLTTDVPFKLTSASWEDDANWNRWSNLGNALTSIRMR